MSQSDPEPDAERTVETDELAPVDATALDLEPVGLARSQETVTLTGDRGQWQAGLDATEREHPGVPPGTVLDGRYRLDEQVGAGGGGLVYRAVDLLDGGRVAVKLLRPDRVADERARVRFRREFRAIARLDHPHCLAVRAEGRAGPYLFMVMDFVPGGDLGRLAGAPPARLLPILVKLAYALDYVHGQRIVHRDLKPGNVLLTDGEPPEPKLADFGIAAMQSELVSDALTPDGLPGTVDYMSPEQVRGDPVDPRSDLYAFGCLIFRLLAGRPPFEGSAYSRLVARLLQPAPPLAAAAGVDPALSAIVGRLLERDPEARYQTALDLARDLAGLVSDSAFAPPAGSMGAVYLFDPGLVGREAEQAVVEAHVAAVIEGRPAPGLLAVVAPAGVGKSRLLQGALRGRKGWRAVRVRLDAAGRAPFAPFPALEVAFGGPDAGSAPGERQGSGRPAAEPWTADLRARINRLAELMGRAAAEGPTVVVIDDLHLADAGAITLLGQLIAALAAQAGPRPALLAAARPVGGPSLAVLQAAVGVETVTLAALDPEGIARMVAAMLGVSRGALPAALAAFVQRTSQGNPLLIGADMQVLAESGALSRVPGGWAFVPPGRDTDLLASELLAARMARLAEPTRAVLARAALCGDRFDSALLAAAFEMPEGQVLDAIDDALRARVVEAEGGAEGLDCYAFAHVRLAEVLYDGIDPEIRRRGHRLIAIELASRPGTAPSALAHHFARSDDRAAACEALFRAGEAALAVYAFETAGGFFERAIEVIDALPAGRRHAVRAAADERLADVWVALGRAPEAVALLERLSQLAGQAPLDRARRLRKLGTARLRTPDPDAGIGALEQALAVLGDRRPRTRAGAWFTIAREATRALALGWWPRHAPDDAGMRERAICHRELGFMYRWIDSERALAHLACCARLAMVLGDPELRIDAYSHVAMGFAFLGLPAPARRLEAAARTLAIDVRDRVGEARVAVLSGVIETMALGDERAAADHFERALVLTEQIGDRFLTDFVYSARGWCLALLGHFAGALENFQAAHTSALELGADWLRADANAGCLMLDVACGRRVDAERRALALASPEIAVPMPALGAVGVEGLGGIAFQEGRFRAAIGLYARARQQYVEHHLDRGWGYLVELQHIEALLCLVDVEGPEAVPDLIRQLRRLSRLATRKLARMKQYAGCAEMARGVIAARRGRAAAARALFARAAARRRGISEGYMGTWLRVRSAIERLHLGDDPAGITAEFEAIDGLYAGLGAQGMRDWLALMRRHFGV